MLGPGVVGAIPYRSRTLTTAFVTGSAPDGLATPVNTDTSAASFAAVGRSPARGAAVNSADTTPSSTREAALALLLRHGESTAAALARRLEVSVQVMRRHLRTLEEEGLVRSSLSAAGPGRPSNQWHLTAQGQGRFPDGSEDFALGLLQSMTESLSEETVNLLLCQQGTQKAQSYRRHVGAGSLQERLERLVDLRRQEGYVAECCPDPDGHSWVIQEFHCSVMRIAEQFPCVCDQELRLIRETFPDCVVERVQWRLEAGHSCGFRLQPVPAS